MATPKEILGYVKRERGSLGKFIRDVLAPDKVSILGFCMSASDVARNFHGQHWRSDVALSIPTQVYPGHSIAVVPTEGRSGVIVDFTSRKIIIGRVSDIHDQEAVAADLARVTKYDGWTKRS